MTNFRLQSEPDIERHTLPVYTVDQPGYWLTLESTRLGSQPIQCEPGALYLWSVEQQWPKIKFHALREHAGLVFQAKL